MKRILSIFLLLLIVIQVSATSHFTIDLSRLSSNSNKKSTIINSFDKSYHLSNHLSNIDKGLEEEITLLTKKTTYLLFGDFDNKDESAEEYYQRKKDWYLFRYNPVNKDKNSIEYKDNLISEYSTRQIFNQASELELLYYSYGDIRVTIQNDMAISSIVLPNVRIKVENRENPMKYDYIESDYIMHYYYKKLNNEWKLYYLYGEDVRSFDEYFDSMSESTVMKISPMYSSNLSSIYQFDKINQMSSDDINHIYQDNYNKIVFLNSYYNHNIVASSNGFFLSNGLLVTSWNFLEDALMKGQYIVIKNQFKTYELEGVVSIQPDMDIALLKVEEDNTPYVKIGNYQSSKVEDAAIVISSKLGVGLSIQKGIITSIDLVIQTSIPLSISDQGSPLFNNKGEVIGISTANSINNSISIMNHSSILQEIYNKFHNLSYDKIKFISFDELKEKYYYVKEEKEIIKNNIPKNIWTEYSKIGKIEETIPLELVKASYQDGIVSLRYQNTIHDYISSMNLIANFKNNLIQDGYKEVMSSHDKTIYKNNKYQVIIMEQFDYLIVVMVKL